MICYPNAKINLGLNVVSRRTDGYHDIESIFLPIQLCDVLEVLPTGGDDIQLFIHGIELKGDLSENLVVKAYRLMRDKYDLGGVEVHLLKNIPTGAGMGGGSSDGVFMLRALSNLFHLPVTPVELHSWAETLGSDCPFFLFNTPSFVTGRGEVVKPLQIDLSQYKALVIHPGIHIATGSAFSKIEPKPPACNLERAVRLPMEDWKNVFSNDFYTHALHTSPVIGEMVDQLYDGGALYAAMTGSGSAVYGIFHRDMLCSKGISGFSRYCDFL